MARRSLAAAGQLVFDLHADTVCTTVQPSKDTPELVLLVCVNDSPDDLRQSAVYAAARHLVGRVPGLFLSVQDFKSGIGQDSTLREAVAAGRVLAVIDDDHFASDPSDELRALGKIAKLDGIIFSRATVLTPERANWLRARFANYAHKDKGHSSRAFQAVRNALYDSAIEARNAQRRAAK